MLDNALAYVFMLVLYARVKTSLTNYVSDVQFFSLTQLDNGIFAYHNSSHIAS